MRTLKQWSDRKKWVEEPLFRSYLFVQISQNDYYNVLNTPGVVRYISFEGKAVPVPPQQIEAIKHFLSDDDTPMTDNMEFNPGDTVEIIKGPMHGLLGEYVEEAGRHKIRIEISVVGQSVLVTVPLAHLKVKRK